jgi:hypothetical protein
MCQDVRIELNKAIITSNVNGLSTPLERKKLKDWIKARPSYMLFTTNIL